MSEEMAVSDNTTGDEAKVSNDEASTAAVVEPEEAAVETSAEPVVPVVEEPPALAEEDPGPKVELNTVEKPEVKEEPPSDDIEVPLETPEFDVQIKHEVDVKDEVRDEIETFEHNIEEDLKRGIKRRASSAFSDTGDEDFKGFDEIKVEIKAEDYSRILDRLEAEVTAASKDLVPLRTVMATPVAPGRASKRPRKDTEGSRPSSALSSRSDGDGATDASATSSPAQRGGRRATTEMSSPLLRVPLERGWKRELVFRAALDAHSRRNADIYYYTPYGKKLRSTREVSEHLAGTGLTVENFSFFKEPLGVDDPEKEIIRDAKLIRRMDSPVAATVAPTQVEGKRTPKPKAPKGVSPEPVPPASAAPANKSPPAKIKVKSMGSRLSNSTPPAAPTPPPKQQKKPPPTKEKEPAPTKQPAPTKEPAPTTKEPAPQPKLQQPEPQPQPPPTSVSNTDNNNSAAWKKPSGGQCSASPGRPPPTPPPPRPPPQSAPQPEPVATGVRDSSPQTDRVHSSSSSTFNKRECPEPVRRPLVQPCSMSCGRGAVPSLSCAACLCLYHPACAGYHLAPPPYPFFCKNCRKSSSSPIEHKSVTTTSIPVPIPVPVLVPVVAPVPRRIPGPLPVPVKVPKLTVKHHSTPDGERVWAVAGTAPPARPAALPAAVAALPAAVAALPAAVAARADAPCAELPQSLALLNGRRFVVVPRNLVQAVPAAGDSANDDKRRGRAVNGAASPPTATMSPRRRGRQRVDDTDHFTAFYNKAQESSYNVVVQIFQYLGMRDLAHCARVCKLWRQLSATPALWRHVRMKNSHVSDWGGLCAALKRHGTKRLDLRKMLLPQNDAVFWEQFAEHISTVDTLERIEMCRCPARAVESVCRGLPGLRALSALAIRDATLDPTPLAALPLLHELRLKSMAGLSLSHDLRHLSALTKLQHLSLTSIKELGWCACDVIGSLPMLESLELGECTFRAEFAGVLARLSRLRRLRLERGTPHCAAPDILRALATLPLLTRLELVNIDVKLGFDDALAACTNVRRLLIIPTYVSQSATTNKQVLSGVLRLKDSLTHLMWGVTIELLRVTELFIDQCERAGSPARRDVGECIPVLKPVPGCRPPPGPAGAGPPQVEILPLPTLQRLLSQQLPHTKLKLLRIPFHATWRQSLADFQ